MKRLLNNNEASFMNILTVKGDLCTVSQKCPIENKRHCKYVIRGGIQMNELQIFKNEEFGEVRSVVIEGKPYFIGKDVTNILGYQNGSRDINRHIDEEDRRVVPFR